MIFACGFAAQSRCVAVNRRIQWSVWTPVRSEFQCVALESRIDCTMMVAACVLAAFVRFLLDTAHLVLGAAFRVPTAC